eukprot:scaffold119790_cov54-Attheya_sp.AAC.1
MPKQVKALINRYGNDPFPTTDSMSKKSARLADRQEKKKREKKDKELKDMLALVAAAEAKNTEPDNNNGSLMASASAKHELRTIVHFNCSSV